MIARHVISSGFSALLICGVLAGGRPFTSRGHQGLDLKLVKQWDLPLDKSEQDNPVVCHDGTVYLLSNSGDVRIVSPNSNTQRTSLGTRGVRGPVAATCDERERLYVAAHELRVFAPDGQGKLSQVSAVPLKIRLSDLAVAPDGSIYGLALDGLVAISPQGSVRQLIRLPVRGLVDIVMPTPPVLSTITWDESHRRLVYGASGTEVRTIDPAQGPKSDAKAFSLGGAGRIARLPNGDFAVVEIAMSEIADVYDRFYLRILNESFRVTTSITLDGPAVLVGSADDGSLYLVEAGKERKLVKVRLEQVVQE